MMVDGRKVEVVESIVWSEVLPCQHDAIHALTTPFAMTCMRSIGSMVLYVPYEPLTPLASCMYALLSHRADPSHAQFLHHLQEL
jgi:hypothetical protein